MKFIIYQDRANEWRWRLVARNGQIIATPGVKGGEKMYRRGGLTAD